MSLTGYGSTLYHQAFVLLLLDHPPGAPGQGCQSHRPYRLTLASVQHPGSLCIACLVPASIRSSAHPHHPPVKLPCHPEAPTSPP